MKQVGGFRRCGGHKVLGGAGLEHLAGIGPGVLTASPWHRYNEVNAISTACSNGLQDCKEMVKNLFHQWMNDSKNNP